MANTITHVYFTEKSLPLKQPYKLSFTTLNEFKVFTVNLLIAGEKYVGEVVPLFGYNNENEETLRTFYGQHLTKLIGEKTDVARKKINSISSDFNFSKSAILTALDFFESPELINGTNQLFKVDFVVPLSVTDNFIKFEQNTAIKIKLTGSLTEDKKGLINFFEINKDIKHPVRLDANQAYTLNQACDVFQFISDNTWKNKIAYIEQPLPANNWEQAAQIVKRFPEIAMMLDESVVSNNDIQRCKKIGVTFVKFKLYKQGGITELETQIELAHKLGLKIVLGNGVAGRLTNQIENYLYLKHHSKIYGASEANGFLKFVN
tara:strand:- start:1852 stop:2808 length:957 start_codon:yes stop_codon:yes gene_type:complete